MSVAQWIRDHLLGGGNAPLDAVSPSVTETTHIGKVVPLPDINLTENVRKLQEKATRKRQVPSGATKPPRLRQRLDKG